ncbi:MAG TPA: hypothetical protein V6D29_16720 [Leptolyngbyaceae cyanobacterium]
MDLVTQAWAAPAENLAARELDAIFTPWVADHSEVRDFTTYLSPAILQTHSQLGLTQYSLEQTQAIVLAQYFDQDFIGDMGKTWNHFVQSGQIWALLIGIVIGYLFRGMTTYG